MEVEGRARARAELSMTPLIDAVFLLLIFFLLTSMFTAPDAFRIAGVSDVSIATRPPAVRP